VTIQTAVAFFAHTRPDSDVADVIDVIEILCELATMAHAVGRLCECDDSIEVAADLLLVRCACVRDAN
jgi:hypothetical protein